MRRFLVFLSLIMLISFRPMPKEENAKVFTDVTLTYSTTTSAGCYGVFMYHYATGMEYFFTFSGSYGTLGPVLAGEYFVSINEITPYCDSYHNRTFQVGSETLYNNGTSATFDPTTINSSNSYVIVW